MRRVNAYWQHPTPPAKGGRPDRKDTDIANKVFQSTTPRRGDELNALQPNQDIKFLLEHRAQTLEQMDEIGVAESGSLCSRGVD